MEKKYFFKAYDTDEKVRLWPCPFCGGEPKAIHKGNNFGKKRSVTIECTQCRCQRTDAALRHDFAWVEKVAADHWNQRQGHNNRNSAYVRRFTA